MKNSKKQERMFSLIEMMYLEGIDQKNFCEREDIKLATLKYWLKHYHLEKKLDQAEIHPREEPSWSKFIPIQVDMPMASSDSSIRIEYPNCVRLHLDICLLNQKTLCSLTQLISCLD